MQMMCCSVELLQSCVQVHDHRVSSSSSSSSNTMGTVQEGLERGTRPDMLGFGMAAIKSNDASLIFHQLGQMSGFTCNVRKLCPVTRLHLSPECRCLAERPEWQLWLR